MTVTMTNVNAILFQTLENLALQNEGVEIYTEQNTRLPSKNELLMNKMNKLFADNKGWASEEEMLLDMAEFRRKRMERIA